MATLDYLTFWLDIKGADKVQKTIENIQKATYAQTKSAISAYLEPIRRREREERKAEALRKKRQKPLDKWNKEQTKFGNRHSKTVEKTLVAQMNAEQRVLYFKNKQAKLDNEFAKTRKQTREWYVAREKQEQNALELARARGRLERQNAVAKQKAYREYSKTESLTAYEKRQAAGLDWIARKEANKEKGQARAVAIAKKRQKEQEKVANSLKAAADKLAKAAEKQKAIAEKQAKIRFDNALRKASQVASTVLRTPQYVYNAMRILSARTESGVAQEAAYYLAGGKRAEAYDVALARYGGAQGEGATAIRSTAAGLGGLRYGNTSFIQTAGRFGIGGLSPNDDPLTVRRKILSRLRNMPANEAMYAASQLGITDAELRGARDTGAALGGVSGRTRGLASSARARDIATRYAGTDLGSETLNELMGGRIGAALEIGGSLVGSTFGGAALYKMLKGGINRAGKITPAAKSLLKMGAKIGGKGVLKAIPFVGAAAGLGFGAYRLLQGDYAGAAGEAASGLASTIPTVGTAASMAISAGLESRDAYNDVKTTASNYSADALGAGSKTLHISTINVDNIVVRGSMGVIENAL